MSFPVLTPAESDELVHLRWQVDRAMDDMMADPDSQAKRSTYQRARDELRLYVSGLRARGVQI